MTVTTPLPLASLSDADLVARCRQGDHHAWNELVHRYSRYVHAIPRRMFRLADADAEDVFQEVFCRAYLQLPRLRDASALRPWLGQLTRRLCVDHLRAQQRVALTDELPDMPDHDDAVGRMDDRLTVQGALARLPEQSHDILERFFARDQSYGQIGTETGLPAGTIASRISRALSRLHAELAVVY